MAKEIRMRAVRRKKIDDEKLALAFLLLAKVLSQDDARPKSQPADVADQEDAEAA